MKICSFVGERRGVAEPQNFSTSHTDFLMKIFGPVLSVGKFHTEQEAIDLANDTTYGLAAGLHSSSRFIFILYRLRLIAMTADQAQCHRVSSALEAGTVRCVWHSTTTKLTSTLRSGSINTMFFTTTCHLVARSRAVSVREITLLIPRKCRGP
jgi:hypothetical protein